MDRFVVELPGALYPQRVGLRMETAHREQHPRYVHRSVHQGYRADQSVQQVIKGRFLVRHVTQCPPIQFAEVLSESMFCCFPVVAELHLRHGLGCRGGRGRADRVRRTFIEGIMVLVERVGSPPTP